MQTDIIPPKRRSNTKNGPRKPMRSQRLRGYDLDGARSRLGGALSLKDEEPVEAQPLSDELPPYLSAPPPKSFWHNWSRRRKIDSLGLALVLAVAAALGGYYAFRQPPPQPPPALVVKAAAKPLLVPSPLTGLKVDPKLAKRPVTGIMVENSLDARPQSGLQDAGVVFEAIAEGGITRFLALFQETQPQYVGPVRSLRPYYYDFALSFDASVAHVGGSPAALKEIRGGGKDLDQFFNAGSYWRQSSRAAPHNVYTSFQRLDALNKSKHYRSSKFTPWPRKIEPRIIKPTSIKATNIKMSLSGYYYNTQYLYDAKNNDYRRSEGSAKHYVTDSPNDRKPEQLHPKVVLALIMPYRVVDSSGHSDYGTTGKGPLYVFQDGGVTIGKWKRAEHGGEFKFLTNDNQTIKLDPGQTWVTILSSTSEISYSAK